jgi:hypothetical protein
MLRAAIEETNKLAPALVVVAGDFTMPQLRWTPRQAGRPSASGIPRRLPPVRRARAFRCRPVSRRSRRSHRHARADGRTRTGDPFITRRGGWGATVPLRPVEPVRAAEPRPSRILRLGHRPHNAGPPARPPLLRITPAVASGASRSADGRRLRKRRPCDGTRRGMSARPCSAYANARTGRAWPRGCPRPWRKPVGSVGHPRVCQTTGVRGVPLGSLQRGVRRARVGLPCRWAV